MHSFFLTSIHSLGDQRLSKKSDHNNYKELTKKEVDVILGYIQLWPQRLGNFDFHHYHSLAAL